MYHHARRKAFTSMFSASSRASEHAADFKAKREEFLLRVTIFFCLVVKNQFGEIFVARISSSSSATTVGGVKCASTASESFYALFFLATATTIWRRRRRRRKKRSRCRCCQKQINIGQKPKHALLPVSGDLIHGWRVVRVGPTVPSVLPRDWIWRHHATKIDRR